MLLFALLGCRATHEPFYCETEPEEIGIYDVTELDYAPVDVVGWLEGPFARALTWSKDDSTTSLTLNIEHSDVGARVLRDDLSPDEPAASSCIPHYEIDIQFDFATADAQFAEVWQVTVQSNESERAWLSVEVPVGLIEGEYRVTEEIADVDSYDDFILEVTAEFTPDDGWGGVTGIAVSDGELRTFPVAQW